MSRFLSIALVALLVACGRPEPAAEQPAASPTVAGEGATPTYSVAIVEVEVGPSVTPEQGPAAVTPTSSSAMPVVVTPTDTLPFTPTIPLTIGEHTLEVELAITPQEQARGLMFRESMPENHGMLFVFPSDQPLSFWMRDTPLPLSIAFIDSNKVILNIEDMEPFDDQNLHHSAGPARYALEVNQGWFAARGIEAGARVEFTLPAAP